MEQQNALEARRRVQLGQGALQKQDWVEAAKRFMEALELDPREPTAWLGQGLALKELGQVAPAREAFVRAAALDPTLRQAQELVEATSPAAPRRQARGLSWQLETRSARARHPLTVRSALHRLADDGEVVAVFAGPGRAPQRVTGVELFDRAQQWAALLQGCEGDSVVVVGRTTLDMVAAWLGSVCAGKPPAFVSFPSSKVHGAHFGDKLRNYQRQLDGAVWVGEAVDASLVPGLITADQLPEAPTTPILRLAPVDAPMFLQCSSGSTGLQKAVAVQRQQLEHQLVAYAEALRLDPQTDRIASWLPLYHDMGLVATMLLPLLADVPVVWMDPFEWAAQPGYLHQVIEAAGATVVWQPNFAYALACRRPVSADLSRVRAFVSCAEPIDLGVVGRFVKTFDVDPAQMCFCYALAENVFCATQTTVGQRPSFLPLDSRALADHRVVRVPADAPTAVHVACVGRPIEGVEVRIVADEGQQVGQILLRGSHTVDRYLAGQPIREDGWMPTGDLGFVVDGQLYVTGRIADVIVHKGKNLYPHELEALMDASAGVYPGRTVVVGVHDAALGTQRVVALFEPDGELGADSDATQRRLSQRLEATFQAGVEVQAVPKGWLRKTSSGKMARTANRDRFVAQSARHVHVVGDSHVQVLWRTPQEDHHAKVHGHWVGVMWADTWPTVFPLIRRIAERIGPDDVLVVAAGEPECRTVFGSSEEPAARIEASVEGYRALFEAIRELRPEGALVYMTGIPTRTHEIEGVRDAWGVVGTLDDRLAHQAAFYVAMREMCAASGVPFVDACTPFQRADGTVREELLHDGVHLDPEHRWQVVACLQRALGVVDRAEAPAPPAQPWDGSREAFDVACRAKLERLARGRTVDLQALVSSGVLDSVALIELVGFLETTFGFDIVRHAVQRMDFETLDGIWTRFTAAG
ncbi:MAG: AMP-binding protein [Myxococcales bacterium]|nr:AMP-binding protein [Myxococcales bacterium]